MATKRKTSKSSMNKKVMEKVRILEEYRQLGTWKRMPVSEKYLEKLCETILEWAYHSQPGDTLGLFLFESKIPRRTFYEWSDKYENVRKAHKEALDYLRERDIAQAKRKELSWEPVKWNLTMNGSDFRENAEFIANLRHTETKEDGKIVEYRLVEVEKIPNSDMVPKRES